MSFPSVELVLQPITTILPAVRLFYKFLSGVYRVVTNLFDKVLVVYFVCNASHNFAL